jgi:hypothetical protein
MAHGGVGLPGRKAGSGYPVASASLSRSGPGGRDQDHGDLLRAARAPEFKQAYPTRSTIERIIAWTATQHGRRIKLRYLGVVNNHVWLRTRCAAINLRTLLKHGLTRRNGPRP